LPEAKGPQGELTGTDEWCQVLATETSRMTPLGWWNLRQGGAKEDDALLSRVDQKSENETARYEHWSLI
jgi:hypothetical protein